MRMELSLDSNEFTVGSTQILGSFVFIDCDEFRLIQSLAWLSVACLNREDDIDSLRFQSLSHGWASNQLI